MSFRLVPKSMTLDDLERWKRSLAEKIVLQSPPGFKSWKLIARAIIPTPSIALCSPKAIHLLPAENGEISNLGFLGETTGGVGPWGKVACWNTKAAISLKHVKIEEKLLWRAYRNSPTLFRTVPSPTTYVLVFPKIEGSQHTPKTSIAIISGTAKAAQSFFKYPYYLMNRGSYELQILYAH